MKIGILLIAIGIGLSLYLLNIKWEKKILKNIGIVVGFFMLLYGLILVVQPSDDEYVKFTKTTIAKENNNSR